MVAMLETLEVGVAYPTIRLGPRVEDFKSCTPVVQNEFGLKTWLQKSS